MMSTGKRNHLRLLDDLRAATTDSAGIIAGRLLLLLLLFTEELLPGEEEEVVVEADLEADLEGEETAPTEAASTIISPSVALSWLCWWC